MATLQIPSIDEPDDEEVVVKQVCRCARQHLAYHRCSFFHSSNPNSSDNFQVPVHWAMVILCSLVCGFAWFILVYVFLLVLVWLVHFDSLLTLYII